MDNSRYQTKRSDHFFLLKCLWGTKKKFKRKKKTLKIIYVYKNSQGKPIVIVIQMVICFFTANMESSISVTESLPNILRKSIIQQNEPCGYKCFLWLYLSVAKLHIDSEVNHRLNSSENLA